jgi:hypothetical protein
MAVSDRAQRAPALGSERHQLFNWALASVAFFPPKLMYSAFFLRIQAFGLD